MKMIKQGIITSQEDLVRLHIIDWNRLNGTSTDMLQSIKDISGWLIGTVAYTVIDHDLDEAPKRNDFPSWEHVGTSHHVMAELFWNDFKYYYPEGQLLFSDEPDFYGTFKDSSKVDLIEDRPFYGKQDTMGYAHFWGDIGQVSASAFALTVIRKMQKGDLWISVDGNQQVILEALEDLRQNFYDQVIDPLMGPPSERKLELLKQMRGIHD